MKCASQKPRLGVRRYTLILSSVELKKTKKNISLCLLLDHFNNIISSKYVPCRKLFIDKFLNAESEICVDNSKNVANIYFMHTMRSGPIFLEHW